DGGSVNIYAGESGGAGSDGGINLFGNTTVDGTINSGAITSSGNFTINTASAQILTFNNTSAGAWEGINNHYYIDGVKRGEMDIYRNNLSSGANYILKLMDVSGNLLNAMQFYGNGTTLTADFGSNPIISGAITSSGNVLVGTITNDGVNRLQVNGSMITTQFRLSVLNTAPANTGDTGTLGEIRIVNNAIYVCIATNTWVRAALSTW
ncbi:MAG: hypothetical protein M0R17_02380, partial [Candidatus Omnitrophica bacterium]|nr:hypothetical protein [Candidatus Omnitrophota bacterium]